MPSDKSGMQVQAVALAACPSSAGGRVFLLVPWSAGCLISLTGRLAVFSASKDQSFGGT